MLEEERIGKGITRRDAAVGMVIPARGEEEVKSGGSCDQRGK